VVLPAKLLVMAYVGMRTRYFALQERYESNENELDFSASDKQGNERSTDTHFLVNRFTG
jgi:hypothetical protein